jgi:hypothetical protein
MTTPMQFGYFVLQAQTMRSEDGGTVRVVLEDLGTGEKRTFDSATELGRFLDHWGSVTRSDEPASSG